MKILTFVLVLFLVSCTHSETKSVSSDVLEKYNNDISKARIDSSGWADSPYAIAKHFYPQEARQDKSNSYAVGSIINPDSSLILFVVESGQFSDGSEKLQRNIYMNEASSGWTIDSVEELRTK